GAPRYCSLVAALIPASRNVGRIDVVLVFFRLVAREALFGGVGHLRLLGISALPKTESSLTRMHMRLNKRIYSLIPRRLESGCRGAGFRSSLPRPFTQSCTRSGDAPGARQRCASWLLAGVDISGHILRKLMDSGACAFRPGVAELRATQRGSH